MYIDIEREGEGDGERETEDIVKYFEHYYVKCNWK